MTEAITSAVNFVVSLGDKYPWLATLLIVIGGIYVMLMLLQPLVVGLAKLTKTDKDDAFLAKMYDILTDWGPCFAPVAALFKSKIGYEEDKK